ncbi:hypothetical protein D9757_005731 [Collybiopsis confluens]|uniref:Cytosine-specific methyltransferase n=1 Tax=Collybiopsis confluens TaxID=2823264 RepID=A0A8H5HQH5_9AGAR|nr:hypothetical protein D9757_005731 [Collybiopsis confluens]
MSMKRKGDSSLPQSPSKKSRQVNNHFIQVKLSNSFSHIRIQSPKTINIPKTPSPSKPKFSSSGKSSKTPQSRSRTTRKRAASSDNEHDSSSSESPSVSSISSNEHSIVDTNDERKSSALRRKANVSQLTPTLTPRVHAVVKNFFRRPFRVVKSGLVPEQIPQLVQGPSMKYRCHDQNPKSTRWGKQLAVDEDKIFYESIKMDGQRYQIGDVVMIEPGDDSRKGREENFKSGPAQSKNGLANRFWFIRISYLFQETDTDKFEMRFHGQWMEHGSKTLLQESAHSRGLFLTNSCADQPVNSIFGKCDVRMLSPGELEIEDDEAFDGNEFFCQYLWDSKNASFLDLPRPECIAEDSLFMPDFCFCHSCLQQERLKAQNSVHVSAPDRVSHFGIHYHLHEFVYLRPSSKTDQRVLEIGQIKEIRASQAQNEDTTDVTVELKIQLFLRTDGHSASGSFADERLLHFSDDKLRIVQLGQVDGKCFVEMFPKSTAPGLGTWIKDDDHFYVLNANLFQCSECLEEHKLGLATRDEYLAKHGPLRCLELFSGAGGLGTGLIISRFAKIIGNVEWDIDAAETYKANNPSTKVFVHDINKVLHHLAQSESGKKITPLPSPWGDDLSALEDIDLISGGPPCQAFSLANQYPKEDDDRATLALTMVSFAELYRPRYFLLENVTGMMHYRLLGERHSQGKGIIGGIEHGMIKVITRALLTLGQALLFITGSVQAANYGVPQNRHRLFIWAARQGTTIPKFPIPTHYHPTREYRFFEHADIKLCRATRSLDPEQPHSFAPFKTVTVNDAIEDLPGFDWVNPHHTIHVTEKDRKEAEIRRKKWPCFEAACGNDLPGFLSGEYAHPPLNAYQQLMREGMNELVEEHVTPLFSSQVVECTTSVPMKPQACHRDLPAKLHKKTGAKEDKTVYYGRLDANSCFRTVMTHCGPNHKGAHILHPSQKRSLSVRESARCQGFPDRYTFLRAENLKEDVRRAYKQIGNAVPIPLALALGKSLGEVVVADWDRKERETSVEA